MADLSVDFAGIKSPNPFWLASAPPANSGEQVMRAFDAGWNYGENPVPDATLNPLFPATVERHYTAGQFSFNQFFLRQQRRRAQFCRPFVQVQVEIPEAQENRERNAKQRDGQQHFEQGKSLLSGLASG